MQVPEVRWSTAASNVPISLTGAVAVDGLLPLAPEEGAANDAAVGGQLAPMSLRNSAARSFESLTSAREVTERPTDEHAERISSRYCVPSGVSKAQVDCDSKSEGKNRAACAFASASLADPKHAFVCTLAPYNARSDSGASMVALLGSEGPMSAAHAEVAKGREMARARTGPDVQFWMVCAGASGMTSFTCGVDGRRERAETRQSLEHQQARDVERLCV